MQVVFIIWTIDSGENDFVAMLKQMDTGLLVTELMGQGVNAESNR